MRYEVEWHPTAENELAQLWIDAVNRSEVRSAGDAIDRALGRDPYLDSESRTGTTRIKIEPPLAVLFEVIEDDRKVKVLKVWRMA